MESASQLSQDKVAEAMKEAHERLLKGKKHPQVLVETSMGPLKIELYEALAPVTVKNFLKYVDDKHYDGTIFHRVISDFMVQGGGFEPSMREKPSGKPIINESYNGLQNDTGTVAMARTSKPDSATAQFFINVKNNGFLNRAASMDGVGYAVFGKVIEGMDVVDKIRLVETATVAGHDDVPVKAVTIVSIRRIDKK
ncbi:MAG: peptidyl-prolyl cis-trans isomerase [Planctomycetes bacterium]|nr:peptidyl-prolyl cis-trans isomerase [Planctomycetota bacterium]